MSRRQRAASQITNFLSLSTRWLLFAMANILCISANKLVHDTFGPSNNITCFVQIALTQSPDRVFLFLVHQDCNVISYPPCKKGVQPGICEKPAVSHEAEAVSLFYQEGNEFIISSPLLTSNFNNDNKEIGYLFIYFLKTFYHFFCFILYIFYHYYLYFIFNFIH